MSENMTYVPSRLTSAKTNKVVAGANEILDDDINLKQDIINTLSKKVIDLNSVPTSSTLTYTVNSVTCNFKIGDEVRVADQESESGYTFYKLYELITEGSVTTATWDKLGAGGGGGGDISDYFEKAVISLAQVGGDNEDIIGATITVLNNDNNVVINTYTWQGSPITCVISPNINYSITLSNIEGYFASPSKSYTSEWNNRREITCYYNTDLGVYIEATDGTLYNKLNWDSNKTPNSIVLLTTSHKLRISLPEHHLGKAVDDIGTHPIEQYCTCITDPAVVKQDFNGLSNTEAILRFNNAYGKTTEDFAAPYCYNFSFAYQPSGKHSYMPAGGQIYLMRQNVTAINECLTACDKNNVTTNWYRSSTVYGNTGWASQDRSTWFVSLLQSTELSYYGSLKDLYPVIPVCDY